MWEVWTMYYAKYDPCDYFNNGNTPHPTPPHSSPLLPTPPHSSPPHSSPASPLKKTVKTNALMCQDIPLYPKGQFLQSYLQTCHSTINRPGALGRDSEPVETGPELRRAWQNWGGRVCVWKLQWRRVSYVWCLRFENRTITW